MDSIVEVSGPRRVKLRSLMRGDTFVFASHLPSPQQNVHQVVGSRKDYVFPDAFAYVVELDTGALTSIPTITEVFQVSQTTPAKFVVI